MIINGKKYRFFKSQRGVKHGDPISPSLFIIDAEALSSMESNRPGINHISYADDLIIFCSGKSPTLKLIVEGLKKYEQNSGQIINRDKSFFLMDEGI